MTAVVLCGGKSLRMGADKGLLQHESLTWAELAANKLIELKFPVVLSVNEQQYTSYLNRFSEFAIIKDNNAINVFGPLKGLLSVHLQFPSQDLLVLACDMPAMKVEVLNYLLASQKGKEEEAFVFLNETHAEPLCAIYMSKGLKKTYERYTQGQLKKHSLHYMLENLDTRYLPVFNNWKGYFNNYNSPEDLDSLQA